MDRHGKYEKYGKTGKCGEGSEDGEDGEDEEYGEYGKYFKLPAGKLSGSRRGWRAAATAGPQTCTIGTRSTRVSAWRRSTAWGRLGRGWPRSLRQDVDGDQAAANQQSGANQIAIRYCSDQMAIG